MIHASPQHEFIGNGDNFISNWLVEKGCRDLWTFSKAYRTVLRFCSQISTPNIMKISPFSLSWMQVVKCLIVASKYESPDLGINSSLWHWSNWNLPFPTLGLSQFPQKIITLCSLSSIYYLQLPSEYLNKERSNQDEGSEILFTINYIILPTKKRKITYSLIFSRAFDVSLKPVFFLLLLYS